MTRVAALAIAAGLGLAGVAGATPPHPPEAMDVDREDAPPGRGELGFDGGAPLGDWALAASLGVLDQPIELHGAPGVTTHPVSSRETLGLGGGLAIGDAALVDLRVGWAHQAGDRFQGFRDDGALATWVPLDARLGARVRVLGGAPLELFVRGELTAPLGNERDFAGEAGWTGAWSLIARGALPGGVVVAASGGVRIRGKEVTIADERLGDEAIGALGVVVPLPAACPLWCADQVKLTGEVVAIVGDANDGVRGPSPVEARLGVVSRPRAWLELTARVGRGLDDEIGAPAWRATLTATWRQPAAPVIARPPPAPVHLDDPTNDDD